MSLDYNDDDECNDDVQKYERGLLMMGVVNREYRQIIRSPLHPYNKWLVSYQEWPRDQVQGTLLILELENNLHGDFTITEKAPSRVFSLLKTPLATSAFTLITLFSKFYAKRALKHKDHNP